MEKDVYKNGKNVIFGSKLCGCGFLVEAFNAETETPIKTEALRYSRDSL